MRRLKDLPLLLVAGLLLLPVLAVLGSWFSWNGASGQILREMAATVLPDYALTSLVLGLLRSLGRLACGVRHGDEWQAARKCELNWKCQTRCDDTRDV